MLEVNLPKQTFLYLLKQTNTLHSQPPLKKSKKLTFNKKKN